MSSLQRKSWTLRDEMARSTTGSRSGEREVVETCITTTVERKNELFGKKSPLNVPCTIHTCECEGVGMSLEGCPAVSRDLPPLACRSSWKDAVLKLTEQWTKKTKVWRPSETLYDFCATDTTDATEVCSASLTATAR